ncbi:hypothetical protein O7621_10470 [Solwaraspora sp. WMMD937]|uniref:hypothetical protein n=1 Tax=Solwaraspora sp. WMMD937 TaxID=3016090 RepID=UPI00249B608C|nr:hypothetical protein [Solwaraspora sp. WMMD937]WFE23652.1 hypothetical protein O7621_10470 [Solwaraspora sp. WMMD937]
MPLSVVVLVAVVTAGAAVALQMRGQPDATATPTAPCVGPPDRATPSATAEATATAAPDGNGPDGNGPDGNGLDVVESGFTQLGSTSAPITRNAMVSIGAVVANTSTHTAHRALVTFDVLDDAGESAVLTTILDRPREIPVILPGERVGVGGQFWIRSEDGQRVEVARVNATVSGAAWTATATADTPDATADAAAEADADAVATTAGGITTRHLQTRRHGTDQIDATVTYETRSPYCQKWTSVGASAVFRDDAGTVVGGGFDPTVSPSACLPGQHSGSTLLPSSLPPAAADTRTEVYQHCAPPDDPQQ